ncbi:Abi family protein [Coprobacillaceae bacterium CR2/5/TPMF4]|nr:Abi family protein [Coprobacillaceae bacterium CR2/5/TPMF4]
MHLDFEYLVELSKLDMYLREYIIKLSLDTEHFLKVKLINDLTNNDKEDGYNIISQFFQKYPYIKRNIDFKRMILLVLI